MFFDGDLQSGIALALRESKVVACFIKSDDEQSTLWENEYLKDGQISLALSSRAVTLCIHDGSPEAGFLAAYYPIPVVPAFIVIHKGQLLLDLRSGETKDSFKVTLLKTLVSLPNAPSTSSSTVAAGSAHPQVDAEDHSAQHVMPAQESSNTTSGPDQPAVPSPSDLSAVPPPRNIQSNGSSVASPQKSSSSQSSQTVQNLLADRRRRLEIDKKEKEIAEKAERKAKADSRKNAMTADPNSAKAKQATYAQQQRKRQQEAKLERERILKQIEHDKAERKEKEELRKALAKAEAEGNDGAGGLIDQQLSHEMNRGPRPTSAKECALQIRLFDGTTIRSRFPSDQTLRTDVRSWVDKERNDGDLPYTFKQILTPLPNRTLSISEEEESLQTLGLTPSATLVLLPVQSYTAAYSENQGIVARGATAGYNVVAAGAGLVTGALGTFLGLGQVRTPEQGSEAHDGTPPAPTSSEDRSANSGVNIRTLRDQRQNRDDHQLYNGNQLNFEPRRDPEDKED